MLLVYKITARFVSASTVVSRRVCSQLPSRSVCGHLTIVAWCVRVIQQSSSSSPQTTIVGPTKVAWCVPSFNFFFKEVKSTESVKGILYIGVMSKIQGVQMRPGPDIRIILIITGINQ